MLNTSSSPTEAATNVAEVRVSRAGTESASARGLRAGSSSRGRQCLNRLRRCGELQQS